MNEQKILQTCRAALGKLGLHQQTTYVTHLNLHRKVIKIKLFVYLQARIKEEGWYLANKILTFKIASIIHAPGTFG